MKMRWMVVAVIMVGASLVAEAGDWMVVPHMGGSLAISLHRVDTVWYAAKGEPASSTLRIIYDGNAQGKVLTGTEASAAWQAMQGDKELLSRFLWVPHMGGSLGIAHHAVQALFFAPAEGATAAKLRIIHDVDTKVIEGADAEKLWKELSAK